MKAKEQQGFSVVEVLIVIVVIGMVAAAGWLFMRKRSTQRAATTSYTQGTPSAGNASAKSSDISSASPTNLIWMQTEHGWKAKGTPPACPDPLLATPTDLTHVTTILYPGQTRGGNYKPHGGFRFDTSANDKVTVTVPFDAYIVRGSRYLVSGETQYTFDAINNCGYMFRVGHLLKLSSSMQALSDKFPAAKDGDSRTENVNPPVLVKKGDVLATAVGTTKGGVNTFFDFGIYDLRSKNKASENAAWASNPAHDEELAQHAVCWFDLLPKADAAKVRSLPAGDPTSGKTSDYCQ